MRILSTLICLLLISSISFGQCQVDTSVTHNMSGIYPDSAIGLPHAIVGVAYSTDIQFVVPVDTTYNGLPAIITSITVTSVTGLPTGFSYTCNPANCTFPGGTSGCMLLLGNAPTSGMVGSYPIVVNMTVVGTIFGITQSIPATNANYSIIIDNNVAVISPTVRYFNVGQSVPNPAQGFTSIPVSMQNSSYVDLKISDLIGKIIYNSKVYLQKGNSEIPLNTSLFPKGIYIYTISDGKNTISKRMIIANE